MTKTELIQIVIILVIVFALAYFNFQFAEAKARDFQRKADLKYIRSRLEELKDDFGLFPLSTEDGRIIYCGDDPRNLQPCEWGEDRIGFGTPAYIERLPADPLHKKGYSYRYESNGKSMKIYASLERITDDEYNRDVASKKILCGKKICNFGLAAGQTPLLEAFPTPTPLPSPNSKESK